MLPDRAAAAMIGRPIRIIVACAGLSLAATIGEQTKVVNCDQLLYATCWRDDATRREEST